MFSKFTKIFGVIVGLLIFPIVAFAQLNLDASFGFANELGVEVIPTYPRPNEMVYVSLSLYTGDLNSADITWYKDGKNVLSGKGETRYSFRAGPVGTATDIEINVRLLGGSSFSKTLTFNPASVDMLWEADTYIPPFYKGKALHSRQGVLKIVAMPEFVKNGRRVSPQNLIYEWSNRVEGYQNQSGYGKNTLILNGSLLGRTEEIEVLVTDPVNNMVAQSFIDIAPTDPQIVFYENDPYYGQIFDRTLSGVFDLKTDEVQILAAPYHLSKENFANLKYEWRLNGRLVPELTNSRTAIFKKPEGEAGQSNLSLRVENLNRVLQQADSNLVVRFKK